jgi:hypothetical protein
MMAARLRNAGWRIDNSVSVENGFDARLSGNWGRCDAEKKRNSDDHREYKGTPHSLTPYMRSAIMPLVMMTVVSRECKGETGRLARLIAISGDWQR